MHPVARRILLRSLFVVVALGILGYGYAHVLAFVLRMNAPDRPAHDELMWRVPVTLAGTGLIITILTELGIAWIQRHRKPAATTLPTVPIVIPVVPPAAPPVVPPTVPPENTPAS